MTATMKITNTREEQQDKRRENEQLDNKIAQSTKTDEERIRRRWKETTKINRRDDDNEQRRTLQRPTYDTIGDGDFGETTRMLYEPKYWQMKTKDEHDNKRRGEWVNDDG